MVPDLGYASVGKGKMQNNHLKATDTHNSSPDSLPIGKGIGVRGNLQLAHLDDSVLPQILSYISHQQPFIHCLVNQVAAPMVAHFLTAMGARPAMSDSLEEIEQFVLSSSALYLNLGTPDEQRNRSVLEAARIANHASIPIVIDPVMVDRSAQRLEFAAKLNQYSPSLWRLNQVEYQSLMQKGICFDNSLLAVTGEVNSIISPSEYYQSKGGHKMMPFIIGLGCALSGVLALFQAAAKAIGLSPFQAACAGMDYYNYIASLAGKNAQGPSSFMASMADHFYQQAQSPLNLQALGDRNAG